jgi:hypothetical protein
MTKEYIKTCAICGKEFVASDPRKKCCSDVCNRAYKVKYQTEYKMQRRADRVCAICGGVIDKHVNKRVKYCSPRCAKDASNAKKREHHGYYVRKFGEVKKCKHCGKEYVQRRADHLYCSVKCGKAEYCANKPKKERKKYQCICPVCGKAYVAFSSAKKHCSVRCSQYAYRQAARANKPVFVRHCLTCNVEFKTYSNVQKFCSSDCRYQASRARHRGESKTQRMIRESGLTREQIDAVIYAQDEAPKGKLWELSQKWTKAQRGFARKRYCNKHSISSIPIS